jgi:hypothetical protein
VRVHVRDKTQKARFAASLLIGAASVDGIWIGLRRGSANSAEAPASPDTTTDLVARLEHLAFDTGATEILPTRQTSETCTHDHDVAGHEISRCDAHNNGRPGHPAIRRAPFN